MSRVPDTRASLILRLPTKADAQAWREFVSIYEPFLHRFIRRQGLQDADARELVQDVLLSVVQAVGHWQSDATRAKFRTWLFRIARNRLIDVLSKRQRQATHSGTSGLYEVAQSDGLVEQALLAHRRELFRWAAAKVKEQVQPATWLAFWRTSVDEAPVPDVAKELGITPGAVYIARSRVLNRLKEELKTLEADDVL